MRKKRAVFAVIASLAVSLFILFGCGSSSTDNKASADSPVRFKILYSQTSQQMVGNAVRDEAEFYIYEDTQTHIEYIVTDVYGRGISMTPLLSSTRKPVEGP